MTAYMRLHEKYLDETLAAIGSENDPLRRPEALAELYAYHNLMIGRMQHERLIHLLVTLFTAAVFLFSAVLLFTMPDVMNAVLSGVLAILTLFYVIHYFRLENGVQHWYRLGDEIRNTLRSSAT